MAPAARESTGPAVCESTARGEPVVVKRALLIVPPTGVYVREDRCQSSVDDFAVSFARPPMDLLTAAAYLEAAGVEVAVRDYAMSGDTWEHFRKDLAELEPELLLISATTSTLRDDLKACVIAKETRPRIVTCLRGVHFRDREALMSCPQLDAVLRHEDAAPVADMAAGMRLSDIRGITYRRGGGALRTPDREFVRDLDNVPMPALHLIDNRRYVRPDNGRPCAHIETGRGCPGQCFYCLVPPIHGRRIRTKSPQRVVDEVERWVRHSGIRDFHFKSDTFTWHKRWVLAVCREILDRGLKIEWFCNSRVDTLDEERLIAMKAAGCFAVGLGIESGSQEILDRIGKGITLEQSRKAVAMCRQHGMLAYTYFMIGFPWDTHETVRQTIDFACKLGGDFADIFIAYPFDGTKFAKIAGEEGLLLREHGEGAYAAATVRTHALSADELRAYRRRGMLRFYLRPGYIARRLVRAKHPRIMWNYAACGMKLLRNMLRRGSSDAASRCAG
ncbi:MAG: radical SAM protein [Planctomycetota bacterium]